MEILSSRGADEDYSTKALGLNSIAKGFEIPIEEVLDKLGSLSEAQVSALLSSSIDFKGGFENLLKNLPNLLVEGFKNQADKNAPLAYENASDIISGLQTGKIDGKKVKEITESEQFKSLLNELVSIKETYPEIAAEADMVSRT